MLGETHDLDHEFPEYHEKILDLVKRNPDFSQMFAEYNDLDEEVRRIETGAEVSSDEYLEERKMRRLHLKDALYSVLKAEDGLHA